MSDYISREAAIDRLNKNLSVCNPGTFSEMCYADAIETVKHLPSADAVPVVRCKDCVHWREAVTNDKGFLICPASGMEITESDFCSYGEREENNGVD